jgi:alpha-N-acetylglucosamine transferase
MFRSILTVRVLQVALLVGDNAHPLLQQYARKLGVRIIHVNTIPCGGIRRDRYAHQFTKLHLWNMTSYSHVIYTDADTFFPNNVRGAHLVCPMEESFCGVQDSGKATKYFNGGVMIIRPSKAIFAKLWSEYKR